MAEGTPPSVREMTGRLAEAPPAFAGSVDVAAVLSDVLADLGHQPLSADWLAALAAQPRQMALLPRVRQASPDPDTLEPAQVQWLRAAGLVAWLLADPAIGRHVPTRAVLDLLSGDLHELTRHVAAADMVTDDDRREELVRLLCRAAGITPAGETPEQAADRLATLDTVHRLRVIAESRAAEEHARKVREALARKRAQEAAAKAMRE